MSSLSKLGVVVVAVHTVHPALFVAQAVKLAPTEAEPRVVLALALALALARPLVFLGASRKSAVSPPF